MENNVCDGLMKVLLVAVRTDFSVRTSMCVGMTRTLCLRKPATAGRLSVWADCSEARAVAASRMASGLFLTRILTRPRTPFGSAIFRPLITSLFSMGSRLVEATVVVVLLVNLFLNGRDVDAVVDVVVLVVVVVVVVVVVDVLLVVDEVVKLNAGGRGMLLLLITAGGGPKTEADKRPPHVRTHSSPDKKLFPFPPHPE